MNWFMVATLLPPDTEPPCGFCDQGKLDDFQSVCKDNVDVHPNESTCPRTPWDVDAMQAILEELREVVS